MAAQTHTGGCHCGRVAFTVLGDLADTLLCTCSVCTKKGCLHLIVEQHCFTLLRGADALTTYTFNSGVAQHLFCSTCGVQSFYVPRSDPDCIDINVRCLDHVDLTTLSPAVFDGRNWEAAFASRQCEA